MIKPKLLHFALICGLCCGLGASAKQEPTPNFNEMSSDELADAVVHGFHDADLPKRLRKSELEIFFCPISALVSGQPSYSTLKLRDNLIEALRRYDVHWKDGRWNLDHDDGRSVYPTDRRLKGIRYRGRVFLVDGHHKALTSIVLGAETIPVELLGDWSNLSERAFHEKMVSKGYAFGYTAEGKKSPRFWLFNEMIDDANLYLARLVEFKIKVRIEFGALQVFDQSGADQPLIVKINEDVPFLEFYVAHALRQAGLEYDPSWGKKLPPEVVAKIRKALMTEQRREGSMLKYALVINDADLDFSKPKKEESQRTLLELLLKHFRRRLTCESILTRD